MKSLGLEPSESELQDILNEVDVDSSGSIDFDGWSHYSTHNQQWLTPRYRILGPDGTQGRCLRPRARSA